jgi:hypothetical protein
VGNRMNMGTAKGGAQVWLFLHIPQPRFFFVCLRINSLGQQVH